VAESSAAYTSKAYRATTVWFHARHNGFRRRIVTVLATWTRAGGLGQSPDDEGEAERLNYKNITMKNDKLKEWCKREQL